MYWCPAKRLITFMIFIARHFHDKIRMLFLWLIKRKIWCLLTIQPLCSCETMIIMYLKGWEVTTQYRHEENWEELKRNFPPGCREWFSRKFILKTNHSIQGRFIVESLTLSLMFLHYFRGIILNVHGKLEAQICTINWPDKIFIYCLFI